MTRDYKHVGGRDEITPRPSPGGRPPGFLSGLTLGLAFAVSLHFYHVLQREQPVAPPVVPTGTAEPTGITGTAGTAGTEEPTSSTSKPATDEPYDFFDILTKLEIIVPGREEVTDAPQQPSYTLQAGSFRTQRTAEFLREQLKSLEFESEVQKVELDDGDVWYSVHLGPYDSLSRVNNIKIKLRRQGIESVLKKD